MARQSSVRSIVIGLNELEALQRRVQKATHADLFPLLDAIGDQQVNSAKRRINETKTGPDGKRWAPWSKAYAKTRGGHQSLLKSEGELSDTMTHVVDGDAVEIGSPLAYALPNLFGIPGRLPSRPYLDTEPGFADSRDRAEIRDILRDFMGNLL